MTEKDKINIDLFNSLRGNLKDPFLLLDQDGNIVWLNNEAENLFEVSEAEQNIFGLTDEKSAEEINSFIEDLFAKGAPVSSDLHIVLKSGSEINCRFIANKYSSEGGDFIFCSFIKHKNKVSAKDITTVKVKSSELNEVLKDKDVVEIIADVKSLYPFTFIGKEKIQKKADGFENFFWIRDTTGVYRIVNQSLAKSLGIRPAQMVGNKEKDFLPAYVTDFYDAVDKYIGESLNCVVLEGLPIHSVNSTDNYQTVLIPLSDADNSVIAIIGVTQRVESLKERKSNLSGLGEGINLTEYLPKAVALMDKNGIIRHGSEEFCKLFSDEFKDLRNLHYTKVLPLKLSDKVKSFLNSSSVSETLELKDEVTEYAAFEGGVSVSLAKIFDEGKNFTGFSVFIERIDSNDDLELLINNRGRMFEILVQNNPEPIFIYDAEDLRFIEVNESALTLYGYRKDEFLQMDLTDLYTPEDIQTLLDSSGNSGKEGKFTGPYRHKRKDGSSVFVEISKISFKYNDKDAHFNIVRDVTEKLDLEKTNQLFKAAFNNTNDLLFVTDNSGFITFINKAVSDLLGYSRGDLENTSFPTLVKDDERATVNTTVFHSHLNEPVSLTMEVKNSAGDLIETELTATPVLDYKGEVESFIILGKRQQEGGQVVREVIKEVEVEKPSHGAGSSGESSSPTFLSSLFHEILTPINVILGFVQELTESLDSMTPDQKEATDIINQNRVRLLNTMNSVVEFSNFESNRIEINPVEINITEIIDQLHSEFDEISGSMDLEFAYGKISSSLKFRSDKQKFQTLTSLLMKISAHITQEKKIYFSAYQADNNSFVISIKDGYSSASKNFVSNLTAIMRSDEGSLARDFGLSRLNIKLAKSILGALHGKFEVADSGGEKPDPIFVFPADYKTSESAAEMTPVEEKEAPSAPEIVEETPPPPAEEIQPEPEMSVNEIEEVPVKEEVEEPEPKAKAVEEAPAKSHEKLDISTLGCLYIEDQVDSQILFKVQMKGLKEIKFAVSFEEALPLLDNRDFDFIVMDINLQGEYNGLDALKIIHKMPGYENIPIVAVTAYVLPGDKEKFIAAGFNDFISKPIFREKMIDSLEKIFSMQV